MRTLPSILAAALLPLMACMAETDRSASPASDAVSEPSTLRLYYQGDEAVFSPAHWVPFPHIVFASLFRRGPDGEEGWLVDRWEVSGDERTWTYHLREDARWHDGVPVTTADIEFSLDMWNRSDDPDAELELPYVLEVLDDHTFSITYENVGTRDYFHSDVICFPKHHLEPLDPDGVFDWEFWKQPVGNGPFRYVRHIPGVMTELEADPDYFLEGPRVEKLTLRYGGIATVELLAGNVDMHIWASPMDQLTLESDPRFDFSAKLRPADVLYWNVSHDLLSDVRVRRALTLAIDRRELARATGAPDEVPIVDGPADFDDLDGYPAPLPFDPSEARRLLAEAGWRDTDSDRVLDRDGQEFRFTMLTHHERQTAAAVVIQQHLRQVGVEVEVQTLDRPIVKGRVMKGEFEAAISFGRYLQKNVFGSQMAEDVLEHGIESPIGYHDPELFLAWDAASTDFAPGAWKRLNVRTWEILQRDVPVTFLIPDVEIVVFDRKIRGVNPFRGMHWLDQVWIEEESP